jgi:hypothetical protein
MGKVLRFGGAFTLTLVLQMLLAAQPAGATNDPEHNHSQVIGYRQVGLTGSEGPLVVNVTTREAAAIFEALENLPVTNQRGTCVEALKAFSIRVLPANGKTPTFTATEYDCPSPGTVTVRQGDEFRYFSEDCGLQNAVREALPPGRAEGTRHDPFAHCVP